MSVASAKAMQHHGAPDVAIRGREQHDVTVDEHVEQVASGTHFKRRRNLQWCAACVSWMLVLPICCPIALRRSFDRCSGAAYSARRLLRLAQLGAGSDDAQEQCRREDPVEVLVDVRAKTRA